MAGQATREQKRKTVSAWAYGVFYTLLLNASSVPFAFAGPTGGQVVGGAGSISHSGAATTINQNTQNMAINWQSYNVNANERVQYIQPNSSSISLNRILSQSGSTIAGRIDANGQVILVNPNGVFFTPTSVINVGGIIASGLDIQPTDFMNGNYIFNEVLGTDGAVINSGMINASLGRLTGGGNVALIGKQVKNDGVIVATLGSVSLAAGKQAVLTFDQGGLLGVRVSKEILQDELGVDPAVVNSGDIQAEGGRVLLTASTSQDVFSQAVNTSGMDQATSVVVHADGSFTLGGGADVINTGSIDASTNTNDQNVGRIILIGENVTSSGVLNADAADGNGGEIELHSQNMTLLTENSMTSARSESNGQGGIVKVLGDKVGLFDQSTVNVSGANGGGQALIGGDYQGSNSTIKNASETIINPEAQIFADALSDGDGGKVIVWANGNTYFAGNISTRGGAVLGDGGFVEVSGKESLSFLGTADRTATNGQNGLLLLDPRNLTIQASGSDDGDLDVDSGTRGIFFGEGGNSSDSTISASALQTSLGQGNVRLQANNNIRFSANVTSSSSNDLLLHAGNSIFIDSNIAISLRDGNFTAVINHGGADTNNRGVDIGSTPTINERLAVFSMGTGSSISTSTGDIDISTGSFNFSGESLSQNIGDITLETLNTSRNGTGTNAGTITVLNTVGDIILNDQLQAQGRNRNAGDSSDGGDGGDITLTATAGDIQLNTAATISSNGGNAGQSGDRNGGDAGAISLTANNVTVSAALSANGGDAGNDGRRGSGNNINITVSQVLTVSADISALRGSGNNSGNNRNINFIGTGADNIFNINDNPTFSAARTRVAGNGGDDRLVRGGSAVTDTTWTVYDFAGGAINGVDDGTLAFGNNTGGNAIEFVDVGSLTGGALDDTFIIQSTGTLQGMLSGGLSTTDDTLAIQTNGTTVQLGSRTDSAARTDSNLNVNGVETITANAASTNANTIIGDNIANIWSIGATTSVAPTTGADANNTVTFSNFGVLTGGTVVDTFDITATFTGDINGGADADDFNIGADVTGTISGDGGNDNFDVTAATTGQLQGGTGNDTFNLGADVTGVTNGGTGNDTFNVTVDVAGQLQGGDDNDTFNINADNLTVSINGGNAGTDIDVVVGNDSIANANVWNVSTNQAGTLVNGTGTVTFGEIEDLTGGTGVDQFTIGAAIENIATGTGTNTVNVSAAGSVVNTVTGAGDDTIDIIGSAGSINAGNGTNTVTVSGTVNTSIVTGSGVDSVTIAGATATVGSVNVGNGATNTVTVNNGGSVTGNITGGTGNETITIADTGAVGGVVNAGAGTADNLIINSTAARTVQLSNTVVGAEDFTVAGVETINADGSFGGNTLRGPTSGTNIWTIATANDGSVAGVTFNNFANLEGGGGNDTFIVNAAVASIGTGNGTINSVTVNVGGSVTGAITGGSGVDNITLNGGLVDSIDTAGGNDNVLIESLAYINRNLTPPPVDINGGTGTGDTLTVNLSGNVWALNNATDGTVTNGAEVRSFAGFENLASAAGSSDILDYSGVTGTVSPIDLNNISGIGTIIGNNNGLTDPNTNISTLIAWNNNTNGNTWLIGEVTTSALTDGVNDGMVSDGAGTTVIFENFNRLTGGNNTSDTFTITNDGAGPGIVRGAFNGTIDGGGGTGTNTLVPRNVDNTWTINAANSTLDYTVNVAAVPTAIRTTFNNIQQYAGGSLIDNFTVNTSVGGINAGDGNNSVIIAAGGSVTGAIIGGTGVDSVTLNAGSVGSINLGDGSNDVTVNVGTSVTGAIATGIGGDTINIYGSAASVSAGNGVNAITVDNGGSVSGAITGGTGIDTITLAAAGTATVGSIGVGDGNNIVTVNVGGNVVGAITTGINDDTLNIAGTADSVAVGNGLNGITVSGTVTNAITGGSGVDTVGVSGSVGSISTAGAGDAISISGTGSVSGVIDGGAAADTLTIMTTDGDKIIQLASAVVGGEDFTVDQVETITATGTAGNVNGNTLRGPTTGQNTWSLGATNIGSVGSVTSFSGISNLIGGNDGDTFIIGGTLNSLDGGTGTNNTTINSGGNVALLSGGAGVDTIIVNNTGTAGAVDFGDGANVVTVNAGGRITGAVSSGTGNDTYTISGRVGSIDAGDGTNGVTVASTGIVDAAVVTGNGTDTINVSGTVDSIFAGDGANGITVSGTVTNGITGGNGIDTVLVTGNVATIDTLNQGDSVTVEGNGSVTTINLGLGNDVFRIQGTGAPGVTMVNGDLGDDSFFVETGTVGTINMGPATNTPPPTDDDFFQITGGTVGTAFGGAGDDRFDIAAGATVMNSDGGNGIDFIIDNTPNIIFDLGTALNGFEGIESGDRSGTLNGQDVATVITDWTITGDNAGSVDDGTNSLSFIGFVNLNGGRGVDRFTVNANGSISGVVSGGGNNDTLSVDLNSAARTMSGQINFVGGAQGGGTGDMITVTGTNGAYSESFNPNTGVYDQIVYDNGLVAPNDVTFALNYTGAETVNDNIQTSNLTINSSNATDNIQLGANIFGSSLAEVAVNYAPLSKNNITVVGQGTSDVEITGAVNIGGELNITADQVIEMNAGVSIAATTLTLNSVRLAGTNLDGLTTDVSNLNVVNHTGAIYIDEQDAATTDVITLTALSGTAGNINVTTATGSISSAAALQYGGALTLNSANNIDLLSTQNNLTGPLDLTAANTVTVNNSTVTNLAGVSAQNLVLVSDGDVIDTGTIDIQNAGTGLAQITSTTGSIILDDGATNFDIVNLTAANDATLIESDGISITNTTVGGALNVTSNNGLAANDAAIGNMALGTIDAATIDLNASEGAIVDQSSALTATSVTLAAATGIGGGAINYIDPNDFSGLDTAGAINTTTSTLSAINSTSGTLNIRNAGDVTVQDLRNGGDIILTNSNGDILLSVTQGSGGNPSLGAIDANFNGNNNAGATYLGSVAILNGTANSVYTNGSGFAEADIRAENLLVQSVNEFGTPANPIRVRVNNQFTLFASQGAVSYIGLRPNNIFTSANLTLLIVDGVTGLSGQQLIDLETLGEVDPAIFTEVRNYNYDDIAIMLPADQRYTDEEEDKKKEQQVP